MQLDAGEF